MSPRALIAALLCLPFPAGAQYIPWKSFTCTYEYPDPKRGEMFTFAFSESGYVLYVGKDRLASVTRTKIMFCVPLFPPDICYTISRISGRFDAVVPDEPKSMNGSCIPEGGEKPKFRVSRPKTGASAGQGRARHARELTDDSCAPIPDGKINPINTVAVCQ